jgi:hypothetical protein
MEFNEEREKIGLPPVQRHWEYSKSYGFESWGSTWRNPTKEREKPYYWKKTVAYDNDTIILEYDVYREARRFNTIDGTSEEMLNITYYFADKQWKYVFNKEILLDHGRYSYDPMLEITKAEADSILKLWNIDRELK